MTAIRSFWITALIAMFWVVFPPALHAAQDMPQQSKSTQPTAGDIEEGKASYMGNCSSCHGPDGSGGMGPNIRSSAQTQDDQGLFRIIRFGVGGMPGINSLNDKRAGQVIAFLHTLGGSNANEVATGDAAKGKTLYEANGCAGCHAVDGQGSGAGPELTHIGRMRAPSYLHDFLLNPGAKPPADPALSERGGFTGYLMTTVVTKDGKQVQGIRVNEDTFTIQLRDLSGRYYSFDKADLQKLEKEPGKSVMPSYTNLSAAELNDLVAYLSGLKGAQ